VATYIFQPISSEATLYGVNDAGEAVGTEYFDGVLPAQSVAVLYNPANGVYTTIDAGGFYSFASGVNSSGQIVGYWSDGYASGPFNGFLASNGANGAVTTLDFPDAESTVFTGINDSGLIVGYANLGAGFEGFLYSPGNADHHRGAGRLQHIFPAGRWDKRF
jgi:hypothetical protein